MMRITTRLAPLSRQAFARQAEGASRQVWARQPAQMRASAAPARALNTGAARIAAPLRPSAATLARGAGRTASQSGRRTFRFSTRWWNSGAGGAAAGESLSFSQRFKKLSREYGKAAIWVYLSLSILDFPFCFLFVRWVGTERIGELEHWVAENIFCHIPEPVKNGWAQLRGMFKREEKEHLGNNEVSEHVEMAGWGIEKAQQRHQAEASIGTQLALAYAIHKSFIFFRVPLTAAVTPKIVKTLRSWGWNIGKRKTS